MKLKNVVVVTVILILLITSAIYALKIDKVNYSIKGNFDKLESIGLELDNYIDSVNTLGLLVLHDGDSFKLQGNWGINFLRRPTYNLTLNFILPVNLDHFDIGKGIGLAGEGFYYSKNRFYWKLDYFLNRDGDNIVYEGGLIYPLKEDMSLRLGIGNNYWNRNGNMHLGIEVDI